MKKGLNSRIMMAVVVSLDDEECNPANATKVRVRIPQIHGPEDESQLPPGAAVTQIIPNEFLPWAQIIYPLGTENPDKHEFLSEGEVVYILFPKDDGKTPMIVGTTGNILEG